MRHYKNEHNYDVLDFCFDTSATFIVGNILKYLFRDKDQDDLDIAKALVYLHYYDGSLDLHSYEFVRLCEAYCVDSTLVRSLFEHDDKTKFVKTIKLQATSHANRG